MLYKLLKRLLPSWIQLQKSPFVTRSQLFLEVESTFIRSRMYIFDRILVLWLPWWGKNHLLASDWFWNQGWKTEKETQMYRTDFWTLWEKARVGCFKRTASKHVYYLGWNRSSAQVGCMRQVLGPGALGRPRGIRWRGRWEGGSGWGIHVYPWLIHVNVWQKPLQYCKVISLKLI